MSLTTRDIATGVFYKILHLVIRKMICQTYRDKSSEGNLQEEGKRARENTIHPYRKWEVTLLGNRSRTELFYALN